MLAKIAWLWCRRCRIMSHHMCSWKSQHFLDVNWCLINDKKRSDIQTPPFYPVLHSFLRFSTKYQLDQSSVAAAGQHGVKSTWLALTLVQFLFPSESSASSPAPTSIIVGALCDVQAMHHEPYLFKMLAFLDPCCNVGLTRAAVNVLKKLIQVKLAFLLS